MTSQTIARGLGWASLGIGLGELLAPRQLESTMGLSNGQNTGVLRTLGMREILHGVDLLTHDDLATGLWGRVAGDVLDTALLGVAATKTRKPVGFSIVTAMVLGIGLLDLLFARRLSR